MEVHHNLCCSDQEVKAPGTDIIVRLERFVEFYCVVTGVGLDEHNVCTLVVSNIFEFCHQVAANALPLVCL